MLHQYSAVACVAVVCRAVQYGGSVQWAMVWMCPVELSRIQCSAILQYCVVESSQFLPASFWGVNISRLSPAECTALHCSVLECSAVLQEPQELVLQEREGRQERPLDNVKSELQNFIRSYRCGVQYSI